MENLHTVDISSTTYLPRLVNVVKERPLRRNTFVNLRLLSGIISLQLTCLMLTVNKYTRVQ